MFVAGPIVIVIGGVITAWAVSSLPSASEEYRRTGGGLAFVVVSAISLLAAILAMIVSLVIGRSTVAKERKVARRVPDSWAY